MEFFFSFSSSEFFCLGSYGFQDELFRGPAEKIKRDEVWETSVLVAFFHVRVYITHTLASVLASKTSPRGMHDKQLVIVTVFCYTDVIGFSGST